MINYCYINNNKSSYGTKIYKFYIDNKKGVKYQTHTHLEGKELGLAGLITGIIGISFCLLLYISLMILIFLENQVF